MSWVCRAFIIMSLVWFLLGLLLGLDMAAVPRHAAKFRFVHVHLALIGWISMMIYGVGYHILPRFSGNLLYFPRMALAQFWLAQIGLVGMCGLKMYRPAVLLGDGYEHWAFVGFAAAEVLAALLFTVNVVLSIQPRKEAVH